jgi:hypothetical protein
MTLAALRRVALPAALAGAAASLGFMLYAGRRNLSRLPVPLLAAWCYRRSQVSR